MVGACLEELIYEVAIGGMNLHAVEARRAGAPSGKPIVFNRRLDLIGGECPGRLVGLLALGRVDPVTVDGDC